MKNIQVIDGADNSIFPIYSVSDTDFKTVFPEPSQNIEFTQNLVQRLGSEAAAGQLVQRITKRHINKREVAGIHGTLFIDLAKRRKFFPNKREYDVFVP